MYNIQIIYLLHYKGDIENANRKLISMFAAKSKRRKKYALNTLPEIEGTMDDLTYQERLNLAILRQHNRDRDLKCVQKPMSTP